MEVANLEREGRSIIDQAFIARRPDWVGGNISPDDSAFLAGLIAAVEPQRLLEIGVASGWSSAVILRTLEATENQAAALRSIDLLPHYYLDKSKLTGQVVRDLVPDLVSRYSLHTGRLAFEVTPELEPSDFVFIDADHLHPWAVLDLVSVLPFVATGSWIAMHDINLCRIPRHAHRNRGPFYLFGSWPDRRLASSVALPMIGAVLLEQAPRRYLDHIIELLATPWEASIPLEIKDRIESFVRAHFGATVADRFVDACAAGSRPR